MTSVIHDIGYQRYQGSRLGRGYAVRSLYVHSLRAAYGLGRSAKAKIFPWLVAGLVGMVAVVVTAVRAGIGETVLTYDGLPEAVVLLTVLFVAVVAPELVSRDLRSGVLPLYFSRPLRRTDYALAKLVALMSAVWLLLAGPMLVMFFGGVFSVDGWGAIWDEFGDFAAGLGYAAIFAVLFSAIALVIASFVGRRAVAAGAIVAVFLVSLPVVGLLEEIGGRTAQQISAVFSPMTLPVGIGEWLFGGNDSPVPGPYAWLYVLVTAAVIAAATSLLLVRYRRVQQ